MNPAPYLLRIDCSARTDGSHSRQLADWTEARWRSAHPGGQVIRRDLAAEPIDHLSALTIQGFHTPPDQLTPALRDALDRSDALIAVLKSAHTVLIAAPIYNFSVPSSLKAWIDQVVRIGHTFAFDGQQFQGLVTGPRAVLALSYGAGGYLDGGPMAGFDHLQPYLTALLGFLGIQDIACVAVEGTTGDAEGVSRAMGVARAQIERLFDPVAAG